MCYQSSPSSSPSRCSCSRLMAAKSPAAGWRPVWSLRPCSARTRWRTVHDLFAWQRVRWEACSDLMTRRVNSDEVPADQIDGGFEFNNQLPNERTIYTTSVNGDL